VDHSSGAATVVAYAPSFPSGGLCGRLRQSKTLRPHLFLPLFEIALVLVRLNHVPSVIVNANHGIM
jgi:hypothetical protein